MVVGPLLDPLVVFLAAHSRYENTDWVGEVGGVAGVCDDPDLLDHVLLLTGRGC